MFCFNKINLYKSAKWYKFPNAALRNSIRIKYTDEYKNTTLPVSPIDFFDLNPQDYILVLQKSANFIKNSPVLYNSFMLALMYSKSKYNLTGLLNSIKNNQVGDVVVNSNLSFDLKSLIKLNFVMHRAFNSILLSKDVQFEELLLLRGYLLKPFLTFYKENTVLKETIFLQDLFIVTLDISGIKV